MRLGLTFDPERGRENSLAVVLLVAAPLLAVAAVMFAHGDGNAPWFYAVRYVATVVPTYLLATKAAGYVRRRWIKMVILGIGAAPLGVYTLVTILFMMLASESW